MEAFVEYLSNINNPKHRKRVEDVLLWITENFPSLETRIAWNQPMFTDHGTFIIGFSIAKQHMAVAPEKVVISRFSDEIVEAGYQHTKEIIRIKWGSPIDFPLLEKMIAFNILDKADCTTFWRK